MSDIADVRAMSMIEAAIAAAQEDHPEQDEDGSWRSAWANAWVACLLSVEQVTRRTSEMIRLGIIYGLEVAMDGPHSAEVWSSWSKLWAMIWANSWCMELARSERGGLALFKPEVIADRVLATSLRIIRSMHPDKA